MPNPVKRHSRTRRDRRRSHDFLSSPSSSICPQCKNIKPPHRTCPVCGVYKGKTIIPDGKKPV